MEVLFSWYVCFFYHLYSQESSDVWVICVPSVLWRCWLGGRKGIKDTSLLVSSGTNCLNLFQAILILASTTASDNGIENAQHSYIPYSICGHIPMVHLNETGSNKQYRGRVIVTLTWLWQVSKTIQFCWPNTGKKARHHCRAKVVLVTFVGIIHEHEMCSIC